MYKRGENGVMELMMLEEAIRYAEELAEENEKSLRGWKECKNRGTGGWSDFDKEKVDTSITRCSKCAAEYRQFAEWLKESKRLNEGLENIKAQIAFAKATMETANSDYMTGYICALSAVEGMITEVEYDKSRSANCGIDGSD